MTTAPAYRIDGDLAGPEAFYAAACDPRRSVVVEACAGAGKTWMLVSRILRALLDGAEPSQILAITFTRKAAGEMRQRLDEWLAEFAAAPQAERIAALRHRGLAEAAARAQADALAELQERVLRAGRAVEVRTFHGWFAQLVSQAPLELLERLQLPPQMALIEDTKQLRDPLFVRFHRAVDADDSLRTDYLSLVHQHRRGTLLQWLEAAWQRSTEVECADRAGTLEGSVPAAADVYAACAGLSDPCCLLQRPPLRAAAEHLASALGKVGKAKPAAAALALRLALDEPDAALSFDAAIKALFTDKGEPRKQLGDLPEQGLVSDALLEVREMVAQQAAHLDHVRMVRLSRVLLAEFAVLKRQRGLVDMADLERAALAMLSDPAVAGWVQERLDLRLRHVLIDEFQDTSPLQWQALHGWLASYGGAGGGASGQRPLQLFIVGDPKQSIYRFRRAEPRVFEAARAFVTQGLGGQVLECDHTRRNAPAVVEALNAVFEDAALQDGWMPFRAHTTSAGTLGGLRRLPEVLRPPKQATAKGQAGWRDSLNVPRHEADEVLRMQEAEHVAMAVAAMVRHDGLQPGDVMVLSRKRTMLSLVSQALAARQVPHVVPEALALAESPEALDLIAVLDVLASPGHDLALARALKSPLFGAADDDLLWLAGRAGRQRRSWVDALSAAPLADVPSPALQRARGLLAGWSEVAGQLPPHDLLDRIVHEGDVLARLAAAVPPARRGVAGQAVQALLAAALEQDGGRYATVYGFVRALRAGFVQATPSAPADAVRLLTVHGAKGLEARAVIVTDAEPERRNPDRATLLVDWPVDLQAPRRVAFVLNESRVPPSLAALLAEEQAARSREELNGLYVAMTRAREWLLFSRTEPYIKVAQPRPWWPRVRALATPWLPAPVRSEDAAGAACVLELPALGWRSAPAAVAKAADDPAAARLGQAVHRLLEWIGRPAAPLARAAWADAAASAARAAGVPGAAAEVLKIAATVADSPATARFFGGTGLLWAGNEVPMALDGEPLRLDRLVLLEEGETAQQHWWVLDYKLQARPDEVGLYRAQMQRYVAAVQAAQPGAVVRAAFITGGGQFVPA